MYFVKLCVDNFNNRGQHSIFQIFLNSCLYQCVNVDLLLFKGGESDCTEMPGQVPTQPVTKSVLADSTEECETACLADVTCAGFTLTDSGRGPSCELMPSWEGVEDDTTGDTTFFVCRGEFCP